MKKLILALAALTLILSAGCFGGGKVKGNITPKDKIYHLPDDPSYERTKAEVYFNSEEEALKAGFRHSRNAK